MQVAPSRWVRERFVLMHFDDLFSRGTLRKWRAEGRIATAKIGGVLLYDLQSIEALFSSASASQTSTGAAR